MKLFWRLVFNDSLLAIASVPAWPYNWLQRKRMEFICRYESDAAQDGSSGAIVLKVPRSPIAYVLLPDRWPKTCYHCGGLEFLSYQYLANDAPHRVCTDCGAMGKLTISADGQSVFEEVPRPASMHKFEPLKSSGLPDAESQP